MSRSRTGERVAAAEKKTEGKLFMGCFTYDVLDPGEGSGSFEVLLKAPSPRAAIDAMRVRVRRAARNRALFTGASRLYLDGLIELRGVPASGVIVNLCRSIRSTGASMVCLLPVQRGHSLVGYDYHQDGDEEDAVEPFIDSKGPIRRPVVAPVPPTALPPCAPPPSHEVHQ